MPSPRRGRPPVLDKPRRFEIGLPAATWDALGQEAERTGDSVAEIIRRAVDQYLAKK